jgi:hypothetical protein
MALQAYQSIMFKLDNMDTNKWKITDVKDTKYFVVVVDIVLHHDKKKMGNFYTDEFTKALRDAVTMRGFYNCDIKGKMTTIRKGFLSKYIELENTNVPLKVFLKYNQKYDQLMVENE